MSVSGLLDDSDSTSTFLAVTEDFAGSWNESFASTGEPFIFSDEMAEEIEASILDTVAVLPDNNRFGSDEDDCLTGDSYEFGQTDSLLAAALGGELSILAEFFASAVAGEGEQSEVMVDLLGSLKGLALVQGNDAFYGDDFIKGRKGDDELAGEFKRFAFAAEGGNVDLSLSFDSEARVEGESESSSSALKSSIVESLAKVIDNSAVFGDDEVRGGSDNDRIVGDSFEVSLIAEGGDASAVANAVATALASDPGLKPPQVTVSNEATAFSSVTAHSDSSATLQDTWLAFGSDKLHGGTDDDHLTGDAEKVSLSALGGTAQATTTTSALAQSTGRVFDLGNQGIPSATAASVTDAKALAEASVLSNRLEFGDDKLFGGGGENRLVGDVDELETIAIGGSAFSSAVTNADAEADGGTGVATANATAFASASVYFTDNEFLFGDDKLVGGGERDVAIGDVDLFFNHTGGLDRDIDNQQSDLENGHGRVRANTTGDLDVDSVAYFENNLWHFGDDLLMTKGGDDLLIGDVNEFVFEYNRFQEWLDNPFVLGDDTLEGGDGADFIVGDIYQAGELLIDQPIAGVITFGNDVLTGGGGNDVLIGDAFMFEEPSFDETVVFGADTFVFGLDFGLDSIGDFQVDLDVMDLTGFAGHALDFDAVMAFASDSADGAFLDIGAAAGLDADMQTITLAELEVADLSAEHFFFG